ncbi:RDD family protein [Ponticoccus alexandrii]|uniref:RDD family protein n=1 Tax=Ponticoccus alexandrii TaxID=1943633 RepID=UPI0003D1BAA4|nr:RDD family protein [Ponticoccus alexandrii]ETA51004.1 hypothetical protein P279_16450 [Rhodobacteraceae bacterium PD-2]
MFSDPTIDHLPCPDRQADFYSGVTVKRAVAWVIDVSVVWAIGTVITLISIVGVFVMPMIVLAVGFLYRWLTISRGSATWGMRLMSIELRDAWGQKLDGGQAALHVLGYYLSMSVFIVQVVSMGFMALSERGQGLTDMVLGTVMLNRRSTS